MRRMFALGIVALMIFLIVLAFVDPFRKTVISWGQNVLGPTLMGAAFSVWTSLEAMPLAQVIVGFAVAFFILGIITHWLWHKFDWGLWRWSQKRRSRDLGVPAVSPIPVATTPAAAASRPEISTTQLETPTETKPEEPQT